MVTKFEAMCCVLMVLVLSQVAAAGYISPKLSKLPTPTTISNQGINGLLLAKNEISGNSERKSGVVETTPQFLSSSSIKEYVRAEAIKNNVNIEMAMWIAEKESNWDAKAIGESWRSFGLWQIYQPAHKDLSVGEMFDIASSTAWAMKEMKKNPEIWSVWRFCFDWFPDCPKAKILVYGR